MTISRRRLLAATALSALAASRGWSGTPQPGPAPAASMRTSLRTRFAGKFTGDELDRLRLGPISIKERTRAVNGDLTVESNPGHGARLTIEVPLG